MSKSEMFNPLNSETLVFIGAGATACLKMPQTADQEKVIKSLCGKNPGFISGQPLSLQERFHKIDYLQVNGHPEVRERIYNFLCILGDSVEHFSGWITPDEKNAAGKIFPGISGDELITERILELRRLYDWNALRKVAWICPCDDEASDGNYIRNLYSILDKKIINKQGLAVPETKCGKFIEFNRLQGARDCLTMLISLMFACAWQELVLGEKSDDFNRYSRFAYAYSQLMKKEAISFHQKYGQNKHNTRQFYLNSVSFVSFNFEPVFLWLFFVANKSENEKAAYVGTPPQRLYNYMELGPNIKLRNVKTETAEGTLSADESSVFILNDPEKWSPKLAHFSKFLFAHGSCCWRECPVCGKLTVALGDSWDERSRTLFPMYPVDFFESGNKIRSKQEDNARHNFQMDVLSCAGCGANTRMADMPMIMQTMFKGIPTSFLEDIQRDIRVSIAGAKHIVLLGYSLPTDDIIWQHAFAESVRKQENPPYCSVVVGYSGPQHWLQGNELDRFVKDHENAEDKENYGITSIHNARKIFGKERVRAYTGGIPQVWNEATEMDLQQFFRPDWVDWKNTRFE